MRRIAIIAALVGELEPLVIGWPRESRNGVELWRRRRDGGEWVAACAGVGVDAATRAFAEIERGGAVDLVVSVGWAGALQDRYSAGRAYRVSGVVAEGTGERLRAATPRSGECWLVTSARVANRAEKRRLAAEHGAGLVDMEAIGVARLAAARGVPFYCIKGVSDGLADRLPDFNSFLSPRGEFQTARFALFAMFRPWYWPTLARLGYNCRQAARSIRDLLREILEQPESAEKRADGMGDAVTGE
jgi:adenosylhomocysteine nucleosidase